MFGRGLLRAALSVLLVVSLIALCDGRTDSAAIARASERVHTRTRVGRLRALRNVLAANTDTEVAAGTNADAHAVTAVGVRIGDTEVYAMIRTEKAKAPTREGCWSACSQKAKKPPKEQFNRIWDLIAFMDENKIEIASELLNTVVLPLVTRDRANPRPRLLVVGGPSQVGMGIEEELFRFVVDPDPAVDGNYEPLMSSVSAVVPKVPWLSIYPDHLEKKPVLEVATGVLPIDLSGLRIHRTVTSLFVDSVVAIGEGGQLTRIPEVFNGKIDALKLTSIVAPGHPDLMIESDLSRLPEVKAEKRSGGGSSKPSVSAVVPLSMFRISDTRPDLGNSNTGKGKAVPYKATTRPVTRTNNVQVNLDTTLCSIGAGPRLLTLSANEENNDLWTVARNSAAALIASSTFGYESHQVAALSPTLACELQGVWTLWVAQSMHWAVRTFVANSPEPVYQHWGENAHAKNFFKLMPKTNVFEVVQLLPFPLDVMTAQFVAKAKTRAAEVRAEISTVVLAQLALRASGVKAYAKKHAIDAAGKWITFKPPKPEGADEKTAEPAAIDMLRAMDFTEGRGGGLPYTSQLLGRAPPAMRITMDGSDAPVIGLVLEVRDRPGSATARAISLDAEGKFDSKAAEEQLTLLRELAYWVPAAPAKPTATVTVESGDGKAEKKPLAPGPVETPSGNGSSASSKPPVAEQKTAKGPKPWVCSFCKQPYGAEVKGCTNKECPLGQKGMKKPL